MNTNSTIVAKNLISFLAEHPNDDFFSTGFENLDNALSGGLTHGLYVLGAISSLGKTTFCLQLANYLSKENDVLFYSLEQTQNELLSKSIKRESYKASNSEFPNSSLFKGAKYNDLNPNQKKAVVNALNSYCSSCPNMYINDNLASNTIEEILNDIVEHMNTTNRKPIIFIDYLQFLHTSENIKDTKRELDTIVQVLKRFIKQNQLTVFLISSFNRSSYKQKVDMTSFSGSGGIEFTADVLIGMQPKAFHDADEKENGTLNVNINDEKNKDVREIELVILKNRHGQCGNSAYFNYVPKYSFYQELEVDENNEEKEREEQYGKSKKSQILGV